MQSKIQKVNATGNDPTVQRTVPLNNCKHLHERGRTRVLVEGNEEVIIEKHRSYRATNVPHAVVLVDVCPDTERFECDRKSRR